MSQEVTLLGRGGDRFPARDLIGKRQEVRIIKKTRSLDQINYSIQRSNVFVVSNQAGFLRSIGFIGSSNAYLVAITLDGNSFLKKSFTEIQAISDVNVDIQAYQDETTSKYVLVIGNLSWEKNINLQIVPTQLLGTITFDNLFALWDEL